MNSTQKGRQSSRGQLGSTFEKLSISDTMYQQEPKTKKLKQPQ